MSKVTHLIVVNMKKYVQKRNPYVQVFEKAGTKHQLACYQKSPKRQMHSHLHIVVCVSSPLAAIPSLLIPQRILMAVLALGKRHPNVEIANCLNTEGMD